MRNYLTHIKSKPPHERRQHAMQVSALVVAAVFVVWISTIGLRFATPPAGGVQTAQSGDTNQTANVVSATNGNAMLMVAGSQ
jgi:hypothetical protein